MITPDRSSLIRDAMASIARPVQLLFFEQSIGCDSCAAARQLVEQVAAESPKVSVEVRNLDSDPARVHGIDRAPAILVTSPSLHRIRFYGAPLGHELTSLLEAVRLTASGRSGLTAASRQELAELKEPVKVLVFVTPSCVYCPQMATLANRLAVESPLISATTIDATAYPDLVSRYVVNGVPKTVINDVLEIIGAADEAEMVRTVLSVARVR